MNKQPKAGPAITRITIGRLYNLGNYEHIRYDVTVEIPPGASAEKALRHVENVIAGLNPKNPFESHRVRSAQELVSRPKDELTDNEKVRLKDSLLIIKKDKAAKQRREKARLAFDKLNGTAVFKDAKLEWDDDFYEED